MEKATRNSWKSVALPNEYILLQYNEKFTEEEYLKISNGLIPKEMENKWFMYLEDQILYIHRSWTGHCIYQITLEKSDGIYKTKEVKVNRNKEQYTENDNEYDIKLLHFLISNFLLGKSIPFPKPKGLKKEKHKGIYQHHISGTAYPESNGFKKKWWQFWK